MSLTAHYLTANWTLRSWGSFQKAGFQKSWGPTNSVFGFRIHVTSWLNQVRLRATLVHGDIRSLINGTQKTWFTMATAAAKEARPSYCTPTELDVLITTYSKIPTYFGEKSNTAGAPQRRETAWQKIADRINARVLISQRTKEQCLDWSIRSTCIFLVCVWTHRCNANRTKRIWQQLKIKY